MNRETHKLMCEIMDKRREIMIDRPLFWSFKSAIIAFAVTVTWTIWKAGLTPDILHRGVCALVGFGIAGFLLGRFIEKPPEIPKREFQDKKNLRTISIDEIDYGMITASPVHSKDGEVLVEAGVALDKPLVEVLREYGIESLTVEKPKDGEISHAEAE